MESSIDSARSTFPCDLFLEVVEIWKPSSDGSLLRRESGYYGALRGFGAATDGISFELGDGLPGKVWERRMPVVHDHFSRVDERRSEAAFEAELAAGIGIPIFDGERLDSVVVLLCARKARSTGVLEVWCESRPGGALVLSGGYYASLGSFRALSAAIRLEGDQGLPGFVRNSRAPAILDDLTSAPEFVRSRAALESGLSRGVGMPVVCGDGYVASVVFLSASQTPFARAWEIWTRDEAGDSTRIHRTFEREPSVAWRSGARSELLSAESGVASEVFARRTPIVREREPSAASSEPSTMAASRSSAALGIPVFTGSSLRHALILYL
jgi:hypothetical protein